MSSKPDETRDGVPLTNLDQSLFDGANATTPSWVPTVTVWAETSKREVSYALCNDRRTLLWFANRAPSSTTQLSRVSIGPTT